VGSPSDEVSDEVTLVELLCLSAQTVASAHDEGRRAVRHTVDDDHEYELVRKVFVLILPCPQLIVGRPHLLRLSKIGQIRLSSDNTPADVERCGALPVSLRPAAQVQFRIWRARLRDHCLAEERCISTPFPSLPIFSVCTGSCRVGGRQGRSRRIAYPIPRTV
jgi:hypothetical protein